MRHPLRILTAHYTHRLLKESPQQGLLLATTQDGTLWISYDSTDEGLRSALEHAKLSTDISPHPRTLIPLKRALDLYFERQLTCWGLTLDLRLADGFHLKVLKACQKIAYGHTISYGRLAVMVNHKKAARAVGQAMGRNPISLIIPCHRVIKADGSLGHYGGGRKMKQVLLHLESRLPATTTSFP